MYAIHGKSATTDASNTAPFTASSGSSRSFERTAVYLSLPSALTCCLPGVFFGFGELIVSLSLPPTSAAFVGVTAALLGCSRCSPSSLSLNRLKNSADASPVPTPMAVLPRKVLMNVPIARASARTENVSPIPENARYSTTATASLSTDSPNTTANRFSSTPRSVNIARTETGSVAPMMDPNIIALANRNGCDSLIRPSTYIPSPNVTAPSNVPGNAK
mmetsp:Transcript_10052/g.27989  ORF Transcript_10052/g.27989 Transcript_10052/m.27989 type:complete len:218 (-) Transcript_10052:448-1101(-)